MLVVVYKTCQTAVVNTTNGAWHVMLKIQAMCCNAHCMLPVDRLCLLCLCLCYVIMFMFMLCYYVTYYYVYVYCVYVKLLCGLLCRLNC